MSGYGSGCSECVRCSAEDCQEIVYCRSEGERAPGPVLCEDHDMYAAGRYDPVADPFFLTAAEERDAAYWASAPREVPGSPGTFRYPEETA